jgi:hypothetical protein
MTVATIEHGAAPKTAEITMQDVRDQTMTLLVLRSLERELGPGILAREVKDHLNRVPGLDATLEEVAIVLDDLANVGLVEDELSRGYRVTAEGEARARDADSALTEQVDAVFSHHAAA